MSKHPNSVAVSIFKEIEPLLVQIGRSFAGLQKLNRKTWERWENGDSEPTADKVSQTARELWAIIHSKEGLCIQDNVLAAITHIRPSAPVKSWKSAEEFGVWFYKLVTEQDRPEIENPESKPTQTANGVQTQPGLESLNPFTWRGAIRNPKDFFARDRELRCVRNFLKNGQSLQIVAPRRMGKSSILLKLGHCLAEWLPRCACAYVDMSNAATHTKAGWLRNVSEDWGWTAATTGDSDFSDQVRKAAKAGFRLVLCLDEFEKFAELQSEFDLNFFRNLRSCAQQPMAEGGLSIITASQSLLSAVNERDPILSAFYNILAVQELPLFNANEALAFVSRQRPGMAPFNKEEAGEILQFAQGHPLKLQIACFQIVEARLGGLSLTVAMQLAQKEAGELLPHT